MKVRRYETPVIHLAGNAAQLGFLGKAGPNSRDLSFAPAQRTIRREHDEGFRAADSDATSDSRKEYGISSLAEGRDRSSFG
jgi:hypothetical protein